MQRIPRKRFLELLENEMALKLSCVSEILQKSNAFSNVLEKRNLTAILLILIPEYNQSNAT